MKTEIEIVNQSVFGKIRVIANDYEPWFISKDIAKSLGYDDPASAIQDHCKKYKSLSELNAVLPNSDELIGIGALPTLDKHNLLRFNLIPETDLYRLIMRSKLLNA